MRLRLAKQQKIRDCSHLYRDLSPAQLSRSSCCKWLETRWRETDSVYIIDACCSNLVNGQCKDAEHIITTISLLLFTFTLTQIQKMHIIMLPNGNLVHLNKTQGAHGKASVCDDLWWEWLVYILCVSHEGSYKLHFCVQHNVVYGQINYLKTNYKMN